MTFLDTARDSAERTGQTIHQIIEKAKPYQTAHITVLLMVILCVFCLIGGYAIGFGQGALAR